MNIIVSKFHISKLNVNNRAIAAVSKMYKKYLSNVGYQVNMNGNMLTQVKE